MLKFAKPILVAAGGLLLAYTLAVLGLNIYLQSHELQSRILEAIRSRAARPITFQGMHYTPWSGFAVTGISVPHGQGRPQSFEAASVNFRFAIFPLLQGRLVVKQINVNAPLLISRNVPKSPPPAEISVPAHQPSAVVETPPSAVEIPVPQPTPPARPPAVEIREINVRNGRSQVYDSKGGQILNVEGAWAVAEILPGGRVIGKYEVAKASAGAFVNSRKVTGTFSWDAGRLVLPDLRGRLSGGLIAGSFESDPRTGFSATLVAEGVLLKKLAADGGISSDGVRGKIFAKGSLSGMPGAPESLVGTAAISLKEARFQPMDIIRQIGDMMSIRELQMLELKAAEAQFAIRNQQAVVESLVLESENLAIDGAGPVGFDGKMKLRARLHLNEKLRNDLRGLIGPNFQDSERPGYRHVPFSITGTLSRPKTDLLDKLTGFRIGQDLGGLIKNIFRAPAKEKRNPEKEGN